MLIPLISSVTVLVCSYDDLSNVFFFFYNEPATPEFYPLSLHDPLPILIRFYRPDCVTETAAKAESQCYRPNEPFHGAGEGVASGAPDASGDEDPELSNDPPVEDPVLDRKSTRLNSSHLVISYAVFCLKK